MGGSGELMAGRCWWQRNYGWLWVVVVKLWLVVGSGDKIMADPGWLWVVAAKLWLVMDGCHGCRWLWVVVGGHTIL